MYFRAPRLTCFGNIVTTVTIVTSPTPEILAFASARTQTRFALLVTMVTVVTMISKARLEVDRSRCASYTRPSAATLGDKDRAGHAGAKRRD
jgi:hypothetical protein